MLHFPEAVAISLDYTRYSVNRRTMWNYLVYVFLNATAPYFYEKRAVH